MVARRHGFIVRSHKMELYGLCKSCQRELGEQEERERGFLLVAVGMDLEGELLLEPFAREYELPFPLVREPPPWRGRCRAPATCARGRWR